jgi:hypothetical protein
MLLMYEQCYLITLSECSYSVQRVRRAISRKTPSWATSFINLVQTIVNILGFPRFEPCRDRTTQQTPLGQKAGVSIRDTEWKYLNMALLRYARKTIYQFSITNCNKRQDQYICCICCDWRVSILTQ